MRAPLLAGAQHSLSKARWSAQAVMALAGARVKDLFAALRAGKCRSVIKLLKELLLCTFSKSTSMCWLNLAGAEAAGQSAKAKKRKKAQMMKPWKRLTKEKTAMLWKSQEVMMR